MTEILISGQYVSTGPKQYFRDQGFVANLLEPILISTYYGSNTLK